MESPVRRGIVATGKNAEGRALEPRAVLVAMSSASLELNLTGLLPDERQGFKSFQWNMSLPTSLATGGLQR